ncbi:MAG: aminotransferase class I/II-fold pyridoxal phosphate-dependent enzyme [Pseudomonadota bacterium]
MVDGERLRHGGGLQVAMERFGGNRSDWLDLSTGISPFPYPFSPVTEGAYTRLPEDHQLAALLDSARLAYGAPQHSAVAAAPGTQALIQLLPSLLPLGRAVVDPVGYQEHGRCWRLSGHELAEAHDPVSAVFSDGAVRYATVIHPHNPSSAWADLGRLVEAAVELERRGGLLVIDEAFCDSKPARSIVPSLPTGALVLRSFGKFYGLAGVRLGFAICTPDLADKLAAHLGPWAVPGPAIEIATQALCDETWRRGMSEQLERLSAHLADGLVELGFELVGRTDLFVTVKHAQAKAIEGSLLEQHVLVRGFDQAPDTLRIGLPGSDGVLQAFMGAVEVAMA